MLRSMLINKTVSLQNSNRVKKKRKSSRHSAKSEPPDKARKLSDTEDSTTSSSGTLTMTQKKNAKKQQHNVSGVRMLIDVCLDLTIFQDFFKYTMPYEPFPLAVVCVQGVQF